MGSPGHRPGGTHRRASISFRRLLRLPRLDQAREVRWLPLVVHRVLRNGDPGLRAAGPDVSHRLEPGGVIERARLDDRSLRIALGVVEQPRAARAAEQAVDHAAALDLAAPDGGRAFVDDEGVARNRKRERKGAARLPLAFRAMADIDRERLRPDLIAHASTLASAGQRQSHPGPIPTWLQGKLVVHSNIRIRFGGSFCEVRIKGPLANIRC